VMNQKTENNLWRAPTDNDINAKQEWVYAGYKDVTTRVHDYRIVENKSDVSLIFDIALVNEAVPPVLSGTLTWTIQNDGTLTVNYDLAKDTLAPFLPRFGLAMTLPSNYEQVEYYGNGPYSSYQDKGVATYLDYFETSVTDNVSNDIKPQESGSHNQTTFAKVSNGRNAMVVTSGDTFSFNTTHYSLNQLTHTSHKDQLEVEDYTYLYIDYAQSGIGSNSCGPELNEAYRLNDTQIKFNFKLNFE
ncbi:beta-galactosidase, partial [Staphylococcus equorum]